MRGQLADNQEGEKGVRWLVSYPNSYQGQIKLKNVLRLWTKAFIAGLVQRRWTQWSKPYTTNLGHIRTE
jgi:hypothetical protein